MLGAEWAEETSNRATSLAVARTGKRKKGPGQFCNQDTNCVNGPKFTRDTAGLRDHIFDLLLDEVTMSAQYMENNYAHQGQNMKICQGGLWFTVPDIFKFLYQAV